MVTEYGLAPYIVGEPATTLFPQRWTSLKRGLLYGHGYNSGGAEPFFGADYTAKFARMTGKPMVVPDLGGQQWAGPLAMYYLDAAYTYLTGRFAIDTKVDLWGVSMGGGAVLNWARRNPTRVNSIALVCPMVDIGDIYYNNRSSLASAISLVYGTSTTFTNNMLTWNPQQQGDHDWDGIPMRIWSSDDDPIIVPAVVTAFRNKTGCQWSSMGSVSHDVTQVNIQEVADFFESHR